MYNVVDSFYAGRISTEALAAMALSFPVFFIIIAISSGLSRGASALIANAIGAKNKEEETTLSGQVFYDEQVHGSITPAHTKNSCSLGCQNQGSANGAF